MKKTKISGTRDCLRAYWSKSEKYMMFFHPLGYQTKCDAGYLCGVLNRDVMDELTKRGYDIKTIKFSFQPLCGNEKFASQRKSQKELSVVK